MLSVESAQTAGFWPKENLWAADDASNLARPRQPARRYNSLPTRCSSFAAASSWRRLRALGPAGPLACFERMQRIDTMNAQERELAELIVTTLNLEMPAADIDPAAPLYREGL